MCNFPLPAPQLLPPGFSADISTRGVNFFHAHWDYALVSRIRQLSLVDDSGDPRFLHSIIHLQGPEQKCPETRKWLRRCRGRELLATLRPATSSFTVSSPSPPSVGLLTSTRPTSCSANRPQPALRSNQTVLRPNSHRCQAWVFWWSDDVFH